MTAQLFLGQLRSVADSLPANDSLGDVLTELLAMVNGGTVSFTQNRAAANTLMLYKAPAGPAPAPGPGPAPAPARVLWGAHVTFKEKDVPSFVHELTHARVGLAYQADMINYAPGGTNIALEAFGGGAPPGAPADTVALLPASQIARRQGWYRAHCQQYLDENLRRISQWADVCDFTAPTPFMDARMKAETKRLTANPGDAAGMQRLAQLQADAPLYGYVMKSGKWRGADAINRTRLDDERQRKKDWIKERTNYGINGMGGLGDTHFEYDTVVNQMLYQMYLWGFRQTPAPVLAPAALQNHTNAGTVPAQFLYTLIAALATEAHQRRMAAGAIGRGAAAAINAPAVPIAAPV